MRLTACPAGWRRGFVLYRKGLERDSLGEMRRVYRMDSPDLVVKDGDEEAICWQSVRSWQSSGRLSAGERPYPQGEQSVESLQGVCRTGLMVQEGDRFAIGEALYELKQVQHWPSHRLLLLERVK